VFKQKSFQTIAGVDLHLESLVADDGAFPRYWRLLSANERQAAQRFQFEELRRRYAICHGKLRVLLAAYLDMAPEAIEFARCAFGKPYLIGRQQQALALQFNLSHSGDRMLLAVGQRQLGVDIEMWNRRHELGLLAQECLSADELAYWRRLPDQLQMPAFYRFWTRKESLLKAVGAGIGNGVTDVVTSTEGVPKFLSLPPQCGTIADWCLYDVAVGDDCSAALTVLA